METVVPGEAWAALWGLRSEPRRRGGVALTPPWPPHGAVDWRGFAEASGLGRGLCPESLACFAHSSVAVAKQDLGSCGMGPGVSEVPGGGWCALTRLDGSNSREVCPGASLGSALGRGQPDQRANDMAAAQR